MPARAVSVALVMIASACGVPREGELRPLGADDLPAALVETTVVTTTTTVFVQAGSSRGAGPWTTLAPSRVDELATRAVQPGLRRAG